MKTAEERAQQLGLSMNEVETACCAMISLAEGIDPHQSWMEYYEKLNRGECAVLGENPPANWNDPLWKIKVPHFLEYCEMVKILETLLSERNT